MLLVLTFLGQIPNGVYTGENTKINNKQKIINEIPIVTALERSLADQKEGQPPPDERETSRPKARRDISRSPAPRAEVRPFFPARYCGRPVQSGVSSNLPLRLLSSYRLLACSTFRGFAWFFSKVFSPAKPRLTRKHSIFSR